MPPPELVDLDSKAVLLEVDDYNEFGRLKTSDVPVEIDCHWVENVTSVGGRDVDNQAVMAQVYVDRVIGLGSIMWHGKLSDFPKDWENDAPSELVEVSAFHGNPDVKGDVSRMWVDVVRYKDAPAEVS